MNTSQNLIIYYFSGTGNSQNVARWMANEAQAQGKACTLINIATVDRKHITAPDPDAMVAFVSPVHGFNYPPVMMHFIVRFPKGKNKVLLMNTRAGMLIGKWVTPGLTGIAFYFSALFLLLKGYAIKGMFPVDMPSNWISLHPGLNARTVEYLHAKNKERVTAFARRIYSGRSDLRALREIVQDMLIAPISLGYYFVGRFLLAKTYYASKDCDNCDLCIKSCPVKAIVKVDNRPFWTFNCESCMRCMGNCPKKAIETGHGYTIAYLFASSVLTGLFFTYFDQWVFPIENRFLHWVVETLLFLSLFALLYLLVHYLMRFRWFERLMVYTSLTKYKFWGRRYKALRNY